MPVSFGVILNKFELLTRVTSESIISKSPMFLSVIDKLTVDPGVMSAEVTCVTRNISVAEIRVVKYVRIIIEVTELSLNP